MIRQLREGRVVAIVGAGVPMGATNRAPCASWQGLLHHAVKRCETVASELPPDWAKRVHAEIDSGDLDDLLSVAEKITQKLGGRGSAEYRRWLEDSVGKLQAADPAVIKVLQELGVTLSTTNYDSLIEEVTGLEPVTWQDQAGAVAVLRGEKAGVLHLHGHWKKPESAVLGIRSYKAVLDSDLTQTILRVVQTTKTALFIGCGEGLNDPNFGALLEWTGDVLGQATHRHFRLCLDGELAALKVQHPPEQMLFPFGYGPYHAALLPFLKTLLTAAGTPPKPAPVRAPAQPVLNLAAYAKAVRERYARLKLESMDPSGSAYRELSLWRVFIPQNVRECQEYLPQVLELPKEHLRRLRESGKWDGGEVDAYDGGNFCVVPGYQATVRTDLWGKPECRPFGLVGEHYQVLQNTKAFSFFDRIIESGKVTYETAGALGDGERVWVLAKVKEDIAVKKRDVIQRYLLLSNGHDGRTALQIRFTPIRVVCQNTLTWALQGGGDLIKTHHGQGMHRRVEDAQEAVQTLLGHNDQLTQHFERFAGYFLAKDELAEYVNLVLPVPNRRANQTERSFAKTLARNNELRTTGTRLFIEGRGNSLPSIEGTLWAAYNDITELVDHHLNYRNPWDRLESVCLGEGHRTKQRAFDAALDISRN